MAKKDSDDDKQDQADEQRDSDELELGRLDPLAGGYSELDDAHLVARILGDPPPPPPRLADRWVLLERLGSGGMGEVHAAYDLTLDCKVAIKFLRPRDGQDAEAARKRLVREAQAMAQIRKHPNVVQVLNAGTEGERVYLVMEYIDGSTLDEWQKEERTCEEALAVYLQAGRGLAAIHAARLVHRDFKPTNALVSVDGAGNTHVAVSDFGLAFATEPGGERPEGMDAESALHPAMPLTATGTQLGTIQYMAPEQLRGEKADARSDQFAFCVSLYEALCGRRPFGEGGASPAALLGAMRRDLPAARQKNGKPLPSRIERVLRRGLSVSPADRFPDMGALLAELAPKPRRAWPWVTAGVLVPALVLTLMFLLREQPQSCAVKATKELAGIWDPAVEDVLRRRIEKAGGTWLARAWEALGRMLEKQAGEWHKDYIAMCNDLERTKASDARDGLLGFGQECLRKNQRTLKQVSQAWFAEGSEVGPHPEARLYNDAVALLELRDCSSKNSRTLTSSRSDVAAPEEPTGQEKLESLGDKLACIEQLERKPDYEAAKKLAREAMDEAKELGHEPVLAEATYRLGHVLTYMDEYEEGGPLLADAADLAAKYDMKALALDIWLYRLKHAAVDLDDTNLARRWIPVTRHALLQTDDADSRNIWQAEYEECLGLVASREGNRKEAMAHHQKALEIREALLGKSDSDLVKFLRSKSLNNLANVERAEKQLDLAVQHYEEALTLREEVLGPNHPLVGEVLFNLGLLAAGRGDYGRAADYLDRALGIEDALPVERIGAVLNRLAAMSVNELDAHDDAMRAGHQERAKEHLGRAERHAAAIAALHRRLEKEKPSSMQEPRRIPEHVLLARIHELHQEFGKAFTELKAALHIHDEQQAATRCGDGHDDYRRDLVSIGSVLCQMNRPVEARAKLENALNPAISCDQDITGEIRENIAQDITRPACRP